MEITLDRQDQHALDAFEQRVAADDAVQQCYRVSPGPDFVLVVHSADMPDYLALAQRLFTADANVRNVKAFFSIKRSKFGARVPLPLNSASVQVLASGSVEAHAATAIDCAIGPDGAAMALNDLAAQRQPHANALKVTAHCAGAERPETAWRLYCGLKPTPLSLHRHSTHCPCSCTAQLKPTVRLPTRFC